MTTQNYTTTPGSLAAVLAGVLPEVPAPNPGPGAVNRPPLRLVKPEKPEPEVLPRGGLHRPGSQPWLVDYVTGWSSPVARNRFTGKIERWGQPFGDPEINVILHRLVMNGVSARKRDLVGAVDIVAEQYAFNPAIDWLESLPSKGDGYIARLFTQYIPIALSKTKGDRARCIKHLEDIGRHFCLGVVERLYSPGAFINCVPVLLCAPWIGIYALSHLMPDDDWFAHDIPSLLGAVSRAMAASDPPRDCTSNVAFISAIRSLRQ
jgi:hypothetical protein